MSYFVSVLVIHMQDLANCLPRLGNRKLMFLLSFICNYFVDCSDCFLFLLTLEVDCVIRFWHSLGLSYKY